MVTRSTTMLRYTYSVSSVPFYVPSLCTSTVCSVYRVLSVIMCSSVLIPPSSRGNCSAVWDAVSVQYTCTEGSVSVTCTSRYRTHVYVRTYSVEILYVILAKKRENMWLKSVKRKFSVGEKNKHHSTTRIRELWWRALDWVFGNGGG